MQCNTDNSQDQDQRLTHMLQQPVLYLLYTAEALKSGNKNHIAWQSDRKYHCASYEDLPSDLGDERLLINLSLGACTSRMFRTHPTQE